MSRNVASGVTPGKGRLGSLPNSAGSEGDDLNRDVVQSLNVPEGMAGCAISCISAPYCVGV